MDFICSKQRIYLTNLSLTICYKPEILRGAVTLLYNVVFMISHQTLNLLLNLRNKSCILGKCVLFKLHMRHKTFFIINGKIIQCEYN